MWNAESLASFMYDTHQSLSRSAGRWKDLEDNDRALRVAVAGQVLDAMEADGLLGTQEERRMVVSQPRAVEVKIDKVDIPSLTRQIAAEILKESMKPEYQAQIQPHPDMPRPVARNEDGPVDD